jgi:hypothetical protein
MGLYQIISIQKLMILTIEEQLIMLRKVDVIHNNKDWVLVAKGRPAVVLPKSMTFDNYAYLIGKGKICVGWKKLVSY